MESNKKSIPYLGDVISNSNKVFKKYLFLFSLVALIYIGLDLYFNGATINDIFSINGIINIMLWALSMLILWIGCILGSIINILYTHIRKIINNITGNEKENILVEVIFFIATMIFLELILNSIMVTQEVNSNFLFYLYSTTNFIACYFGIVKSVK